MKKYLAILVALVLVLSLVLLTGCGTAPDKESGQPQVEKEYKLTGGHKAIIFLPGLLASGLYDTQTGEMVWDPFCTPQSDNMDLLTVMGAYEGEGVREFIASMGKEMLNAVEYAATCLVDDPENLSVLRHIMCDTDGNPLYPVEGVSYRDYEGHQRYGALNSYRSMAQNLEALYGDTYEVVVFNYNWLTDTRAAASKLSDWMRDNNITESILIGHSMGGIVGTEYLAMSAENRARVDKFVTIATPFYGSYSVNEWFEDASFLKEMAVPTLEKYGLKSFLELFDSFFDNVVIPLLYNMTSMYQLLPSPELMALSAPTEGQGVVANGQKVAADALYDFYLTRAWSTLSPTDATLAATMSPRKQMVDWPDYRGQFYVDKGGERIFAADLVDSYYIVGTGVYTAQGVTYDDEGVSLQYSYEGDGTVPWLSASRGKEVDDQHVFAVHDVSHIVLGCYWNGEQAAHLQTIIGTPKAKE